MSYSKGNCQWFLSCLLHHLKNDICCHSRHYIKNDDKTNNPNDLYDRYAKVQKVFCQQKVSDRLCDVGGQRLCPVSASE